MLSWGTTSWIFLPSLPQIVIELLWSLKYICRNTKCRQLFIFHIEWIFITGQSFQFLSKMLEELHYHNKHTQDDHIPISVGSWDTYSCAFWKCCTYLGPWLTVILEVIHKTNHFTAVTTPRLRVKSKS